MKLKYMIELCVYICLGPKLHSNTFNYILKTRFENQAEKVVILFISVSDKSIINCNAKKILYVPQQYLNTLIQQHSLGASSH